MSDLIKFTPSFNDDDVIELNSRCLTKFGQIRYILSAYASSEINKLLKKIFKEHQLEIFSDWITSSGIQCRILKIGSQGWEKGKIYIKFEIEFIPDKSEIQEPESCLDDIRREIQKM